MRLPTLNLYLRLFLWFCLANVVTLLVSVFVTERFARMAYVSTPDWPALAQSANDAYILGGLGGLEDWDHAHHREGIDVTLFENGQNLRDRPLPPPVLFNLQKLLAEDGVVLRLRPGLQIAGQRVTGSDGVARHLVGMRLPRPPPRIQQLLFVQIGFSLLIIGGFGYFVARSIAKPVAALQHATQRMTTGDLSARVGSRWARRGDELGRLAADFDRMAQRIEALVTHERGVLQDVSHELRSPLARLHLLLDLARRSPAAESAPHFERAECEIARLDRIIGEALALARMESQLPGMGAESVALEALIADRIAEGGLEADVRQVRIEPRALQPLRVLGSADLLEHAFDNLLSNAIKFSPEGGEITVSLRANGDEAEVEIRDEGPGVPAAELGSLFRPFFRGSNAAMAEGHGLGLAIVQRVALAHGGRVEAENLLPRGLCVRLTLPIGTELAQG